MTGPAIVAFKSFELIGQMNLMHPKLVALVQWMAINIWPKYGQKFLVVSTGWYDGGSGVHEAYRAMDVSARDWKSGELVGWEIATAIEREINDAWDHGSGGKYGVCLYHAAAWKPRGEWHFHLQVRDATALRMIEV